MLHDVFRNIYIYIYMYIFRNITIPGCILRTHIPWYMFGSIYSVVYILGIHCLCHHLFVMVIMCFINVSVVCPRLRAPLRNYEEEGPGPPNRYCKQFLKQIEVCCQLVAEMSCCLGSSTLLSRWPGDLWYLLSLAWLAFSI